MTVPMMITPRVRARAAELLSMAACTELLLYETCRRVGAGRGSAARSLAFAAVSHVVYEHGILKGRFAEAEALLRTGWSPRGEP